MEERRPKRKRGFKLDDFQYDLVSGRKYPNCGIRKGEKWGMLECVDYESQWMRVEVPGGTIREVNVVLADLVCWGGHSKGINCRHNLWVMQEDDPLPEYLTQWPKLWPRRFPGKWVMRDCGCLSNDPKAQAGLKQDEHIPRGMAPTSTYRIPIQMPIVLQAEIRQYAKDYGLRLVDVYNRLLTIGMAQVEEGVWIKGKFAKRGEEPRNMTRMLVNDVVGRRLKWAAEDQGLPVTTVAIALLNVGLDRLKGEPVREDEKPEWIKKIARVG